MDQAKLALFFLGAFLILVAVLLEVGSIALLGTAGQAVGLREMPRPGLGIAYLGLLDAVLLYTLFVIAADFVPPLRRVLGRLQWLVTFLVSLIGLIATIILIFVAIALLVLMVSLLVAVPFGTLAYFAVWGDFAVGKAKTVLSMLMLLKLGGIVLLLAANLNFLKNKGLVLLFASSVGATFLLGFLHALPPGFLVSITDAIGAIVAAILAAIWMLVFLIGAIPAFVRAVRSLLPG